MSEIERSLANAKAVSSLVVIMLKALGQFNMRFSLKYP